MQPTSRSRKAKSAAHSPSTPVSARAPSLKLPEELFRAGWTSLDDEWWPGSESFEVAKNRCISLSLRPPLITRMLNATERMVPHASFKSWHGNQCAYLAIICYHTLALQVALLGWGSFALGVQHTQIHGHYIS